MKLPFMLGSITVVCALFTVAQRLASGAEPAVPEAARTTSSTPSEQPSADTAISENKARNDSFGVSFDYSHPDVRAHLPLFPQPVATTLSGDLYGGTLYYEHTPWHLRLEGTRLTGTLHEEDKLTGFDLARDESQVLAGFMFKYVYFGAGYEYVGQEYLTGGNIFTTFTKLNDHFHNFFGQAGLHSPVCLLRGNEAPLQIRLIPQALGALGYGWFSDQGPAFAASAGNGWTYKLQAGLQLEFRFHRGWDAFIEGGYQDSDFGEEKRTQGSDFYGSYAQVGLRYSF